MFRDSRPNLEEIYAGQDRVQLVGRAFRTMPKAYRRTLWLRHVQGLNIKEAAETVGLATGTLKSQLHRARQWLSERAAHRQLV